MYTMNVGLLSLVLAAALTPSPREFRMDDSDLFRPGVETPIVVVHPVPPGQAACFEMLFEMLGYRLPVVPAESVRPGSKGIYVGVWDRHPAFEHRKLRRYAEDTAAMGPGGYQLNIWEEGVAVAGADAAGVFHGLQTLLGIAEAAPGGWPWTRMRDWPAQQVRGLVFDAPPTKQELEQAARLKANVLLFDSPDFMTRDAVRMAAWRGAFEQARALRLEPAPVFDVFAGAGPLIAANPLAAEGQEAVEQMVLQGDDWAPLAHRHVLHTDAVPIEVRVSGVACRYREDYLVQPGAMGPPFENAGRRWLVRRVPGGAIPDGAAVMVRYGYVPEGAGALCLASAEGGAALRDGLAYLAAQLGPRMIHLGGARETLPGSDPRSRAAASSSEAVYAWSVNQAAAAAREVGGAEQALLWSAAIEPDGLAPGAVRQISPSLVLVARPKGHQPGEMEGYRKTLAWLANQGKAYWACAPGEPAPAYLAARMAGSGEQEAAGLLVAASPQMPAARVALDLAWSPDTPRLAWPEGLNAFLGSALWRPTFEERRDALAAWLNERSAAGLAPGGALDQFEDFARSVVRRVPEDEAEVDLAIEQLEVMTDYLAMELDYTHSEDREIPRGLARLISRQAELDPAFDAARRDRILLTTEEQQLFVPASILFGVQLLYYRPVVFSSGFVPIEVPIEPDYLDEQGRIVADYDLLSAPGPVCRIDFETVGATRLTLDRGYADRFERVREWQSHAPGGVRGPIVLPDPVDSRYLRVSVESAMERAVLREMRLFALKEPAHATCPFAAAAPGAGLSDISWPEGKPIRGFIDTQTGNFAAAPTEVRLCRTRTHLIVGIQAREPRMHAMVAELHSEDAPLWEQESVSFQFRATPRDAWVRFVVSPTGARYDSLGGDPGWDADWRLVTSRETLGWTAAAAIPFDALGKTPSGGERWQARFERHRYNVTPSRSTWAPEGESGVIAFP